MKYLFVEDQFIIIELLKELASSLGINFEVSETAEQAVQLMKQHRFDVVISDYLLPGMNGIDLTTLILAIKSDTRVYLCTSSIKASQVEQFLTFGGLGVIDKPLTKSKLETIINEAQPASNQSEKIHTKYLPKYVQYLASELITLEKLLENQETENIKGELHRAIHGIKGAADVMNDQTLSALCKQLLDEESAPHLAGSCDSFINTIKTFIALNNAS